MKWWTDVIWDLMVTCLIVAGVLTSSMAIFYILLIYSILLIVVRVSVLFGAKYKNKKIVSRVPNWFFHLLYAINVILLLAAGWFILFIIWVVVWFLAFKSIQK